MQIQISFSFQKQITAWILIASIVFAFQHAIDVPYFIYINVFCSLGQLNQNSDFGPILSLSLTTARRSSQGTRVIDRSYNYCT